MSWPQPGDWDSANRARFAAMDDQELARELTEILNSRNGFAYTPGSSNAVREAVKRLEGRAPEG